MTVQLELVTENDAETIEKTKQIMRDAILSYLSGLHVKDTLGADAKDKIREELMKRSKRRRRAQDPPDVLPGVRGPMIVIGRPTSAPVTRRS